MGSGKEKRMVFKRVATGLLVWTMASILMGMARINIDRSKDQRYSNAIDKQYRTLIDLVIYHSDDSKQIVVDKFGNGLPEKGKMKNKFPYRYYDEMILGVLPAGSVFKTKRVMEEGPKTGTFIFYYAELLSSSNEKFVGKDINVTFLANGTVDPPKFEPSLVEEIKP